MLRLLLIILTLALAPGCSCGSHGSSPDAAVPDDIVEVADSVFVSDARPRDATLPCEGTVAILSVDTSAVPDAYQRTQVRGAREGEGMVLGWFNDGAAGVGGTWMAARISDADAPVATLVDPLPLPGLVGLYTTEVGAVRFLLTDAASPRGGVSRGGWADLEPDGSFSALHRFEAPPELLGRLGYAVPCDGTDADAVLTTCSTSGQFGLTIVHREPIDARFFEVAFGRGLGTCSGGSRVSYGIGGCIARAGVTSVLVSGSDSTQPLALVEWRADGTLLHAEPVLLGTDGGELGGIAALGPTGPVYFVLAGSPDPRIAAYRISGGTAVLINEHALDAFSDPITKPLGVGVLPDGHLMVAYMQSWVLSVIAFDEATGFGSPVIVSNGVFAGEAGTGVNLSSGVYLPLGGLTLLRLCGG